MVFTALNAIFWALSYIDSEVLGLCFFWVSWLDSWFLITLYWVSIIFEIVYLLESDTVSSLIYWIFAFDVVLGASGGPLLFFY
jgi:hypothetical protein